jgi:hypothetical protein
VVDKCRSNQIHSNVEEDGLKTKQAGLEAELRQLRSNFSAEVRKTDELQRNHRSEVEALSKVGCSSEAQPCLNL